MTGQEGPTPLAAAMVREFRLNQRWSQARAAKWFGVHERSWQRWELGERGVPLALVNAMRGRLVVRRPAR